MIVPIFWAEGRAHQSRTRDRPQVTVRRFGWSDASQAEAEAMAEERAQEALRQLLSGKKLSRRERKVAYNGAEGVPIREEVLERHGDVVITRNAYGAKCLNTPDVLFADVDFEPVYGVRWFAVWLGVMSVIAIILGIWRHSVWLGLAVGLVTIVCFEPAGKWLQKLWLGVRGGPERVARRRLAAFIARRKDWAARLYRTPAGMRVLVTHAVFAPGDPAAQEFFSALRVDRVYAAMCRNQRCFRARVSPKPWRVGIDRHLRPRRRVWPIPPEAMEARQSWVREYEAASEEFASCRFIESVGNGMEHAKAKAVRELHDRMSQALSELKIA